MRFRCLRNLMAFVLLAKAAVAANGDFVGRVDLGACTFGVGGVTFDGALLYYTLRFDPMVSTIHRVDPQTSQPEGTVTVKRSGVPLSSWLDGIEYDPNRSAIWVGYSDRVLLVSLATGEIQLDLTTSQGMGSGGVSYDPWNDLVFETDDVNPEVRVYCPNPPFGDWCGRYNLDARPNGVAYDGTDCWFSTGQVLPPPYPNAPGLLFPTTGNFLPDPARAFAQPDKNSRDLAYDCVTFPVPVVWAGNGAACEIRAYEVAPRGPCLGAPDRRLLRVRMPEMPPGDRGSKLPLVTATAERIYRAARPLDFLDAKDSVLLDLLHPLVYYRLVGVGDADQGNVLRLAKDVAAGAVICRE